MDRNDNLLDYEARICQTVAGFLVKNQKVVLVKHKKLGIWLAPGGHIEDNELPHLAAEREFLEETGLKAKAVDFTSSIYEVESNGTDDSINFPSPFSTNLHWISKDNYQSRVKTSQIAKSDKWPNGCEQHLVYIFLMELCNDDMSDDLVLNEVEADGIGWFGVDELQSLETVPNIIMEATVAIRIANQMS